MNAAMALKRIRAAAEPGHDELVGWTRHALEKLGDEIVIRQVLTLLREGELKRGPTWSDEHSDWVCVLRKVAAGRPVHVVVGIKERKADITIVTVY